MRALVIVDVQNDFCPLIADQLISLSFYIIVTVIVLIPMIMLTGNMFMILKNQGIF